MHSKLWRGWVRLLLAMILWTTLGATAEPVTLTLDHGLVARAEYRKGAADKPAVLILHGFLQTHAYPLVHNLTDALASAGYSVLAPTLTLGVTHRKQSLPCEAIHTHTHEDNARELNEWLQWLSARGHSRIVLIGHSMGSAELLLYLRTHRPRAVVHFIALSLVEAQTDLDSERLQKLRSHLQRKLARGDRGTEVHPLSFCRRLQGTPQTFLSYYAITPQRVQSAIKSLRIPATFIMGGGDDRLSAGWIERIRRTGQRVVIIPNASHFLDGEHEFDLIDVVLETLRQVG
ncbi:MAG: alpha/beta fold hydrolase [Burkholderiales bacterium]|nr:alpha/beta fold hydrolase [Burkholderiales bacterium]